MVTLKFSTGVKIALHMIAVLLSLETLTNSSLKSHWTRCKKSISKPWKVRKQEDFSFNLGTSSVWIKPE